MEIMTFEQWWDKAMDMHFTSNDAREDAKEAAERAWNASADNKELYDILQAFKRNSERFCSENCIDC